MSGRCYLPGGKITQMNENADGRHPAVGRVVKLVAARHGGKVI
jgi:hypothetical protein